uniref:Uncharacterized protein n=1 Tax=Brassica oleracea TaxID=3712 RepID=A0A3P6FVC8_BRAOL|nr:unnamed protein product [Brassica oleracea]
MVSSLLSSSVLESTQRPSLTTSSMAMLISLPVSLVVSLVSPPVWLLVSSATLVLERMHNNRSCLWE